MNEHSVKEYPECRGCVDEYYRVRIQNSLLFAGMLVAAVLFFALGLYLGGTIEKNHRIAVYGSYTNYEQGRTGR